MNTLPSSPSTYKDKEEQNRRISISTLQSTSTYFDDDDDMETTVAAEEIQRLWRGKQARINHTTQLHHIHQADHTTHLNIAAEHTEQGFFLLSQQSSIQTKLDQDILEKSRKRQHAQEQRTLSNNLNTFHQTDSSLINNNLKQLIIRFKRCLNILCQNTGKSPFDLFDVDRDSQITRGEFRRAVVEYDLAISEIEMNHLLHHMDSNNDGVIDLSEWVVGLRETRVLNDPKQHVLTEKEVLLLEQRIVDSRNTNQKNGTVSTVSAEEASLYIQKIYRGAMGRVKSTNRMQEKYIEEEKEQERKREEMLNAHFDQEHTMQLEQKRIVSSKLEKKKRNEKTSPFFTAMNTNGGVVKNSNGGVHVSPSKHTSILKDMQEVNSRRRPARPAGTSPLSVSNSGSRADKLNAAAKGIVNDVVKIGIGRVAMEVQ